MNLSTKQRHRKLSAMGRKNYSGNRTWIHWPLMIRLFLLKMRIFRKAAPGNILLCNGCPCCRCGRRAARIFQERMDVNWLASTFPPQNPPSSQCWPSVWISWRYIIPCNKIFTTVGYSPWISKLREAAEKNLTTTSMTRQQTSISQHKRSTIYMN